MRGKNTQVSIIIVNYRVEKELIACICSIVNSKLRVSYEIIIVDNDGESGLKKIIRETFPKVKYIKSPGNIGYGAGNNLGARYAKGDFLFFLNPDTEIFKGTIDLLVNFLEKNINTAIVAPLFLDENNSPYPLQGSKRLTPLRGIFTLSFLYKLLPNNIIAREYLLSDWNKKDIKEVDVVPGTAFMIRKNIFAAVEGFDEKFFLYFEEFDICNRVKKLGYKVYILPDAKVKHLWEVSTKKAKFDIKKVFQKSRFYYFKKYYGLFPAFMVEVFTRLNKIHLLLGFILAFGAFLRLYRLQELMPFIGDQGWFYLSSRDMLLTGEVPLVGITSSHTWLHQGALWTYILGIVLWLFKFNPLSGAYLSIFIDLLAIFILYKATSEMFSKQFGVIASGLYATSPLIIFSSRFAYHTSPIPLFTILFIYFVYKWIKGRDIYFPLIIFIIFVLYNLELATFSIAIAFFGIIVYGFWKKKIWVKNIFQRKIILLSIVAFLVPMTPMLIYDFGHGFVQTVVFVGWIIYQIAMFLADIATLSFVNHGINLMIPFIYKNIQELIFLPDGKISLILFLSSLLYFLWELRNNAIGFIFLVISVGLMFNKTPSSAYVPIFFPFVIIIQSLLILRIINKSKLFYLGLFLFIVIIFFNAYSTINFFNQNFRNKVTFSDRVSAAKEIVSLSDARKYNLIGRGWLNDYKNYIMNYEYLTWWLGNAPSKNKKNVKIYITEKADRIIISR